MSLDIFNIQTLEDFYEYILINMGHPVINQEVAQIHLTFAIKKAIQYYIVNSGINSTQQKVLRIQIDSSNVNEIILPNGIQSVDSIQIKNSGSLFETGVLFDTYSLKSLQYNSFTGFDMIGFEIYGQYMSLIENHFMDGQISQYNTESGVLNVIPTPKIGDELIVVANASFDWDSPFYFNNMFIQDMAVAYAYSYWEKINTKYENRELSSSVTISTDTMQREGFDTIEKLETKFKEENSVSSYISLG